MEMMLWNVLLSLLVAAMGMMLKSKIDELSRVGVLLNRTREEIARENITRKEVDDKVDRIVERFDDGFKRLEAKIDDLTKAHRS
jgi:predicted O-methyltransferase YrrM